MVWLIVIAAVALFAWTAWKFGGRDARDGASAPGTSDWDVRDRDPKQEKPE